MSLLVKYPLRSLTCFEIACFLVVEFYVLIKDFCEVRVWQIFSPVILFILLTK